MVPDIFKFKYSEDVDSTILTRCFNSRGTWNRINNLESVNDTYFITFSRSSSCCGLVFPVELEICLFSYGIHNPRGRRSFSG